MIRILHLSDLHYGNSHAFSWTRNDPGSINLARSIVRVVNRDIGQGSIDGLVLSGDFMDKDQPKERDFAAAGMTELINGLGLDASNVFAIPGNHDVIFDAAYKDKFEIYDDLMGKIGLAHCKRDALPAVFEVPGRGEDRPVAILLLSSCELDTDKFMTLGRVTGQQLEQVVALLKMRGINQDTHTIIAVMHHHLVPIHAEAKVWNELDPLAVPGRVSVTVDAPLVLRSLARLGVVAVLHGHQHLPHRIRHTVLDPDPYTISILSAGSVGAKVESGVRQFFLHEVKGTWIDSTSFVQSTSDPTDFQPSRPSSQPDDRCLLDVEVRSRLAGPLVTRVETAGKDESDLHYFFMSVVDCAESRQIVRDTVVNSTPGDGVGSLDYCVLEGMYDLLGKWDLAIRFRSGNMTGPRRKWLLDPLKDKRMFGKPAGQRDFIQFEWLNVEQEWDLESWLSNGTGLRGGATRRRCLSSSRDYDESRCQRGFLFMRNLGGREGPLEAEIKTAIRSDSKVHPIIESIAVADKAILFEVFMTCSQTALINRLNRLIEGTLSDHRAQKYTLLCYGYDEEVARAKCSGD